MRSSYKLAFLLMASSLCAAGCAAPPDTEDDAIAPPDNAEALETAATTDNPLAPTLHVECGCGCTDDHCSCSSHSCHDHGCAGCSCGCASHHGGAGSCDGDMCTGGRCGGHGGRPGPVRP